jgi:hypothetical protein
MQALEHAHSMGTKIKSIGVSKPPCHPCEQQLDRHGVTHEHEDEGLQNPRNWESPENIVTESFHKISKPKVKFEGDVMHTHNNIPKTKNDVKAGFKQTIKDQQQLHPKNLKKVNLSAAGVLDMIDEIDKVLNSPLISSSLVLKLNI